MVDLDASHALDSSSRGLSPPTRPPAVPQADSKVSQAQNPLAKSAQDRNGNNGSPPKPYDHKQEIHVTNPLMADAGSGTSSSTTPLLPAWDPTQGPAQPPTFASVITTSTVSAPILPQEANISDVGATAPHIDSPAKTGEEKAQSDTDDAAEREEYDPSSDIEAVQFCDYCICLTIGLAGAIAAAVLWPEVLVDWQVQEGPKMSAAIACTAIGVLFGYCVCFRVLVSKFEVQLALSALPKGEEDLPTKGRCASLCNWLNMGGNPILGLIKLALLVAGGAFMLPLFVLPYILLKAVCLIAIAVWKVLKPCLHATVTNCLVPIGKAVFYFVAGIFFVIYTICITFYEYVLVPIGAALGAAALWLHEHVFAPIGRAVCVVCAAFRNYVLKPLWRAVCVVCAAVRDYVLKPIWSGLKCFARTVLEPIWRYAVVWPMMRIYDCLKWICGTCLPAIGRALYCALDTVVLQPLRWVWRNILLPPLRMIGNAIWFVLSAIGRAIAAVGRAIARCFSSVGRALCP